MKQIPYLHFLINDHLSTKQIKQIKYLWMGINTSEKQIY